jgi:hypothetical protein
LNPEEFIAVAKTLSTLDDTEAMRRTAFGRIYYGLFNLVRDDFDRAGITGPDDRNIHAALPRWLRNCGLEGAAPLGSELDDFMGLRRNSDYDLEWDPPNRANLKMQLVAAGTFVTRFRALKRPELYAAVRAYRKLIGERS